MVFKLPPTTGQRHVQQKVKEHLRAAPKNATLGHGYAHNVPDSNGVKWPGHVVDPAWLKANIPAAAKPTVQTCQDWYDIATEHLLGHLKKVFDPEQAPKVADKPSTLWEPLMCDFMEGLAALFQKALDEPEQLAKLQSIPGNKVNPKPTIDDNKLREALAPELKNLLGEIIKTIQAGCENDEDPPTTKVIRCIWDDYIVAGDECSDISDEDIQNEAMKTMDELSFEQEARRRGYRLERL